MNTNRYVPTPEEISKTGPFGRHVFFGNKLGDAIAKLTPRYVAGEVLMHLRSTYKDGSKRVPAAPFNTSVSDVEFEKHMDTLTKAGLFTKEGRFYYPTKASWDLRTEMGL